MDEGQLQLNYLTKVMALCHPFEERFVCHSPYVEANSSIEIDEAEDEDGFEVTVKLKPGDGYPVIVFQKEEVLIGELHMRKVWAQWGIHDSVADAKIEVDDACDDGEAKVLYLSVRKVFEFNVSVSFTMKEKCTAGSFKSYIQFRVPTLYTQDDWAEVPPEPESWTKKSRR